MSLVLGSLIAGAAGLLGAGIGSVGQSNQNAKNRAWSTEENEKNRNFQAQQAQIARDWQEEYYSKFQSPQAQIQQYQDAGLNPSLMYGSGYSPGSAPSGGSPSGGSSISPQTANPLASFENIGSLLSNLLLTKAQIENINANTDKTKAETIGQNISNTFSPAQYYQNLKQGELNLENTRQGINLAISQLNLNNDELLNNVVSRARDIASIRQMSVQNITEYFKQALISAQTVSEQARGKQISLDNFEKQWRNDFIKTKNVNPELASGMWSLVTSALGTLTDTVTGIGSSVNSFLKSNPFNFLKGIFNSTKNIYSPFNPFKF